MKIMKLIKVHKNGATNIEFYSVDDWKNHEMFVRGLMCWHNNGTKFVVKDMSSGEIQVFAKVKNNDPTTGYTELIKLNNFSDLEKMFELFETEV